MVLKKDGEREPLDWEKVKRALRKSGASHGMVEEVIDAMMTKVVPDMRTNQIFGLAFSELDRLRPGAAARFGLKDALFRLGPDGYPFETFVGALLKGRGYSTKLRQIVPGKCVSHEIDVVAERPAGKWGAPSHAIVECKFHNAPEMRCHIQSALYSWARFLDVRERTPSITSAWLATNTKFTTETIQYADCVGLKLLGWSFPHHESIQVRIDENKLYPITVLKGLDRAAFSRLHDMDIILVKELLEAPAQRLAQTGIPRARLDVLVEQARQVMSNRG